MVIRAMYLLLAVAALNVGVQVYLNTAPGLTARDDAQAVRALPDEGVQNPLTLGERTNLTLAMQQCWHRPAALADHGDMLVVMRVEFDPDGKLAAPIAMTAVGEVSPASKAICA